MSPFILGIAGGSASGKSWLAQALLTEIGHHHCAHVAHDDYYKPLPSAFSGRPADYNFDEPAALDTTLLVEHLTALKSGNAVHIPQYDFASHDRVGTRAVEPCPIIIVEGILLFADADLTAMVDLRIFVNAPTSVRRGRRIHRDVAERGREPSWVRERFERHVEPMHQQHVQPTSHVAHLVLSGEASLSRNVIQVVSALPMRLRLPRRL